METPQEGNGSVDTVKESKTLQVTQVVPKTEEGPDEVGEVVDVSLDSPLEKG